MRQGGRKLFQLPDACHEVGATAARWRQQYHVIRSGGGAMRGLALKRTGGVLVNGIGR